MYKKNLYKVHMLVVCFVSKMLQTTNRTLIWLKNHLFEQFASRKSQKQFWRCRQNTWNYCNWNRIICLIVIRTRGFEVTESYSYWNGFKETKTLTFSIVGFVFKKVSIIWDNIDISEPKLTRFVVQNTTDILASRIPSSSLIEFV